jgi:hypothetical protein
MELLASLFSADVTCAVHVSAVDLLDSLRPHVADADVFAPEVVRLVCECAPNDARSLIVSVGYLPLDFFRAHGCAFVGALIVAAVDPPTLCWRGLRSSSASRLLRFTSQPMSLRTSTR